MDELLKMKEFQSNVAEKLHILYFFTKCNFCSRAYWDLIFEYIYMYIAKTKYFVTFWGCSQPHEGPKPHVQCQGGHEHFQEVEFLVEHLETWFLWPSIYFLSNFIHNLVGTKYIVWTWSDPTAPGATPPRYHTHFPYTCTRDFKFCTQLSWP